MLTPYGKARIDDLMHRKAEAVSPPPGHGSPEAIARAFGVKLAREHPRDWPRLLGLAAQAAMEAEHQSGPAVSGMNQGDLT
jgi:hypothetical protein